MACFDNEAADDKDKDKECCNCCPRGHALLIGLACSLFTLVLSVILLVVDLNTGSLGKIGGYVSIGVSTVFVVAMVVVTVAHYRPDACGCLSRGGAGRGSRQTWPEPQDSRSRQRQQQAQGKGGAAARRVQKQPAKQPAEAADATVGVQAQGSGEQAAEEFSVGASVYPSRW